MAIDPNTGLNTAASPAPVLNVPGGPTPPPAPLPVNPTSVILGAGAPPVQPTQQTEQPTTAQPTPDQQIQQKHATFGQAIKTLARTLEGKQTVYTPMPDGTVQESLAPRKPGGLFRDILLGALAGTAAASQPTTHPSGAAGLGLGFQGAREEFLQRQQQQQMAAQRQATQLQAADKKTIEAGMTSASTVHTLALGHHIGLMTDDQISDNNNAENAMAKIIQQGGGQLADIEGNGEKGNAPGLMKKYLANPELMTAAEGQHRLPVITYDTGGLAGCGKRGDATQILLGIHE